MRKSTLIVALGLFIVITGLLCISSENKVYQKERYFNNPTEILEQLQNNKLIVFNQKGEEQESKQFSECLSLRKRIAGSQIYYETISNIKLQELTDKQKKIIEDNYKNSIKKIKNYGEKNNIQAVRFTADVTRPIYTYKSDVEHSDIKSKVIDMVFVDEGEGTVIDYFIESSLDEDNNIEEGKNNVKG
ncbi:hypothetical protein [Clostridium weizhouense]|uniref:Uncharacterized protein n=1 Tax=Clostridium weizhouense TaxID=2859781 RepID=A0ABS7AMT6_9CLOT|nr:hypothetical protein [Clostridium weizhouense]MBW6409393.1 hypothetical protein [Clostridium weizhouense]